MFTATRLQVATYLLGVCPFSIAFLVFLNSSVSFVVTDLIGEKDGVGDAVGSLGFADELVAIVACPIWGLLSDRVGLRFVCVSGYSIICLALLLFVQAKNVYPQLLLARLFFSLGAAAAATMVTAILPAVASPPTNTPVEHHGTRVTQTFGGNGHVASPSIESEVTITPARFVSRHSQRRDAATVPVAEPDVASSTNRVAGFVGMATGCGALIALAVFLPLPAKFQYAGVGEKAALKDSFYIVAAVAFLLTVWCFIGLRGIQEVREDPESPTFQSQKGVSRLTAPLSQMFDSFRTAAVAGFRQWEIAIGYLGGFVARASSVGISLFIPLLVNAMFLSSGLCDANDEHGNPAGLPDIKRRCPQAYIVAAELTGITETVALIFAPIFGYWAAKAPRKEVPLLVASVAGVVGYPLFANEFDPDSTKTLKRVAAFVAASLIGISQIGAIVCSLGTLSKGVLVGSHNKSSSVDGEAQENGMHTAEAEPLLQSSQQPRKDIPLSDLKGSVAGVYSLYGGAAILILTKLGGFLFDNVSRAAPFYIMAVFNAMLTVTCVISGIWRRDRNGVGGDNAFADNR
ncbi:hypothetical protein H2200_001820 [Cladophialophora chaetospira]|uniref:MFS transporter n=1 Tax=Cladophialophora chaetospira TaxID=386627 RepID=A0AA39CND8_9EURO|nr:hypothetical protein H2200_001820 [Cladophialophora chaetospira]